MALHNPCPTLLQHDDDPLARGDHYYAGDQISLSSAAEGEYGQDLVRQAVAYLKGLARERRGIHFRQRFLPSSMPDAMATIGGALIISDEGIIVASLESEP